MKAIVIYDSFFGNTEKIALAVSSVLGAPEDVVVMRVVEAKLEQLKEIDLLVVGSPTRKFTMSDATKAFLRSIPAGGLAGVRVAAFDTRIATEGIKAGFLGWFVNKAGYAAQPIMKLLTDKGGKQAAPPVGFYVQGSEGPLKAGELECAAVWAKQVAGAG